MITIPTVLVLGAGASMPYDFPSGKQLVESILFQVDLQNRNASNVNQLKSAGNFNDDSIDDFYQALFHSGQTSIDIFLEHRPEFIGIGKMAIALSLIPYEVESRLFSYQFETNKRAWYEIILNKICEPRHLFNKNNLAIITFNYDRSIDHYLFTSIKNAYSLKDLECSELIKSIPIIHVHGRLGKLPWQGEPSRPYSSGCDYESLRRASEQIKIITEGNEDSNEFREAHELIHRAKRIFFLGFGYNPTNLRRLKLDKFRYNFYYTFQFLKELSGTTMGIGKTELQLIRLRMNFAPNSFDIIDFFREFRNL